MDALLKTLTPRDERVVKMRFGIGDGSEHSPEAGGQPAPGAAPWNCVLSAPVAVALRP